MCRAVARPNPAGWQRTVMVAQMLREGPIQTRAGGPKTIKVQTSPNPAAASRTCRARCRLAPPIGLERPPARTFEYKSSQNLAFCPRREGRAAELKTRCVARNMQILRRQPSRHGCCGDRTGRNRLVQAVRRVVGPNTRLRPRRSPNPYDLADRGQFTTPLGGQLM